MCCSLKQQHDSMLMATVPWLRTFITWPDGGHHMNTKRPSLMNPSNNNTHYTTHD
jgi:hypothetical protein